MKSTRRATIIAVAAASLLAVGAGSVSSAAAKSGSTGEGHDQRRRAASG